MEKEGLKSLSSISVLLARYIPNSMHECTWFSFFFYVVWGAEGSCLTLRCCCCRWVVFFFFILIFLDDSGLRPRHWVRVPLEHVLFEFCIKIGFLYSWFLSLIWLAVHEPVRIAYDRPRGCPVTKKKKVKNSSGLPLHSENQLSL